MRHIHSAVFACAALALTGAAASQATAGTLAPGIYGDEYYAPCSGPGTAPGCQIWITKVGQTTGPWVYNIDVYHPHPFATMQACRAALALSEQLTGAPFGYCFTVD